MCARQLLHMCPQIKCHVKTNRLWPKTAYSLLLDVCLRLAVENLIVMSLAASVARLGVKGKGTP
jgi:hypothetical protein